MCNENKIAIAKKIFPYCEDETGCFHYPYDYSPIYKSFGEVLLEDHDDNYQGDSRIILKNENRFGFLNFGWGSCSGCDALQGCNSYEELGVLIESLRLSIAWFDSLQELKDYIKNEDRNNTSYYNFVPKWPSFVEKALNL